MEIRVNLNTLDLTTSFPYLDWTFTYNNSDWSKIYSNLHKYQRIWGMVAKVLGKTGALIKARVMMYKEVIKAVIMYGR